jgi:hypothetical protein
MRSLIEMTKPLWTRPSIEMNARAEVAEFTPLPPREEMPSRPHQHSRQYMNSFAWASNRYLAGVTFSERLLSSLGVGDEGQSSYPPQTTTSLHSEVMVAASHLRFGGCLFEVGSDLRKYFRGTLDVAWINAIKEEASSACEVNWPRGPHLGHAPRGEFRNITSRVRRTSVLRDKSARLEIVNQASRPARRKAGGVREICHSQLPIRGFREVHDRGVLTRRQTNSSHEVAIKEARQNFKNPHLGTPKRIFVHGERIDDGHVPNFTVLGQTTNAPWDATSAGPFEFDHFTKYRKLGERV